MRSLYLVRHGKPQYPDEHSYCVGQTDFSLSMLGHLQAVLLNEELSDKISRIYCSPLLRAATAPSPARASAYSPGWNWAKCARTATCASFRSLWTMNRGKTAAWN